MRGQPERQGRSAVVTPEVREQTLSCGVVGPAPEVGELLGGRRRVLLLGGVEQSEGEGLRLGRGQATEQGAGEDGVLVFTEDRLYFLGLPAQAGGRATQDRRDGFGGVARLLGRLAAVVQAVLVAGGDGAGGPPAEPFPGPLGEPRQDRARRSGGAGGQRWCGSEAVEAVQQGEVSAAAQRVHRDAA